MDAEGWGLTFGIAGGAAGIVSAYIAWLAYRGAGRSAGDSNRSADAAERSADASEKSAETSERSATAAEEAVQLAKERAKRDRETELRDRVQWEIRQPDHHMFFELVNKGHGTAYGVAVDLPDGTSPGPYVIEGGEAEAFTPQWPLVRGYPLTIKVGWHLEPDLIDMPPKTKRLIIQRP
ncbi:hypothetical protein [Jiangella anatolica]|uniref:Uncharacterized protein n=1 Tax=Jiangella anatolica TaxID=2670374 RepID=A0A2W2C064_9ACTN|nr:hypothetical protein [Jiangella anatolica]PZF86114.1 hypothetical protein C1I92_02735 [Jiangella anatolica]